MEVIIIAPHPDDETLGCGGTILKHKAMGDAVYWLIMTNISIKEGYSEEWISTRKREISRVVKAYGINELFQLDFPTTKLDVMPKAQMIKSVGKIIDIVKPNIVYLPYGNDIHSDHQVTFEITMSSTKTFRCPFIKKIMMYEVLSETDFAPVFQNNAFVPNSFSDISNYLDGKISIAKIYKSEIGVHPFPRNIENVKALATYRGATAGVKYAESFVVLKEIW